MLSPNTARYDKMVKVPIYERAGVPEVWLINPSDHTLMVYRLAAGSYGSPSLLELNGRTALTAVPGVIIDWDQVLANIA